MSESAIHLQSTEEKDAAVRSQKKIRAGNGTFSEEQSLVPRDEIWMHDVDCDDAEKEKERLPPAGEGRLWKSFKEAVTRESEDTEEEEPRRNGGMAMVGRTGPQWR